MEDPETAKSGALNSDFNFAVERNRDVNNDIRRTVELSRKCKAKETNIDLLREYVADLINLFIEVSMVFTAEEMKLLERLREKEDFLIEKSNDQVTIDRHQTAIELDDLFIKLLGNMQHHGFPYRLSKRKSASEEIVSGRFRNLTEEEINENG